MEYIGLEGAFVNGPRPQLTRVFVNIMNNSIQAVEGMRKDASERGLPAADGCISGKFLLLNGERQHGHIDQDGHDDDSQTDIGDSDHIENVENAVHEHTQ